MNYYAEEASRISPISPYHLSYNADGLPLLPNFPSEGSSPAFRTKIWTPAKLGSDESASQKLIYIKPIIEKSDIADVSVIKADNGIKKFIVQLNKWKTELSDLREKLQSLDLLPMTQHFRGNPCIALCAKVLNMLLIS